MRPYLGFGRLAVLLATTWIQMGCEGPHAPTTDPVVYDSAGVKVVHHPSPTVESLGRWAVSGAPLVAIGRDSGQLPHQLFGVAGALRLSDGRIVIANRGSSELRFFGGDGEHLVSVGSSGDGPGEFRMLAGLYQMEGDSLLAFDFQSRRMSVFAPDGVFLRSFRLEPPGDASVPSVAGVFGDGSILVRGLVVVGGRETQTGVVRDAMVYSRMDERGDVIAAYGEFPGNETYVGESGGAPTAQLLPLGRRSVATAGHGRFFVGAGDGYEIEVRSLAGDLVQIVRMDVRPRAVTAQHVEEVHRLLREGAEGLPEQMRRDVERQLHEMPLPDVFPAYGHFAVDSQGALWVADYTAPNDETAMWTVFSPEGHLLAQLEIDSALRLLDIGTDYILGVRTDDLGGERIELYQLTRDPE